MKELINLLTNEIETMIKNDEIILKDENKWAPEKIGDREVPRLDRMINPRFTILFNTLLTLINADRTNKESNKIDFAA